MKILHFSNSFFPCLESGGVVNFVYNLSKAQVENNNEVSVYTTDGCINRLDTNPIEYVYGVKTFYFKNLSNFVRMKLKLATPYKMPFTIKKDIEKYDILHIHEHRTTLAILARWASKNKKPYVLQSHGSALPFFQKKSLKNVFDFLWGNAVFNNASKVIALTNIEAKHYIDMGIDENKIEIVPNAINLEEFNDLPMGGEFRDKFNIGSSSKIILFLGRLHKIKGVDILVKAFKIFLDENKSEDVKLVIVGPDDGCLDYVNKLVHDLEIEDKVIFTGSLIGKAKLEALVDCDIFVCPSRYDSFPTTVLEALSCYKPVILSKNCHIYEWIHEKAGLACDLNEIALKDSLNTLIFDDDLKKKYSKNGRKLIEKNFNWDIVSKQLDRIYEDCVVEFNSLK